MKWGPVIVLPLRMDPDWYNKNYQFGLELINIWSGLFYVQSVDDVA